MRCRDAAGLGVTHFKGDFRTKGRQKEKKAGNWRRKQKEHNEGNSDGKERKKEKCGWKEKEKGGKNHRK